MIRRGKHIIALAALPAFTDKAHEMFLDRPAWLCYFHKNTKKSIVRGIGMNRRFIVIVVMIVAMLTAICAGESGAQTRPGKPSVEESSFSLSPVAGYLSGHTTYHISYYEGPSGIESELEFPLKTMMAGISGEYAFADYRERRDWKVRMKLLKNIGAASGVMKDSDWLTDDLDTFLVGSAHPGKDIYSESDIDLDAMVVDITAVFNTIREDRVNIGPLVRFLYQKFDYTVSNTNQVGYGPYNPSYTGYVPGRTLEYEVTYKILALGVNLDYPAYQKFRANVQLAYSPWAQAEDLDDHVLRYKLSKGRADGSAFFASAGLNWDLQRDITLSIGGEYLRIRTTGTQRQYFYAGPDAGVAFSVNYRIYSDQLFVSAMLTFPLSW